MTLDFRRNTPQLQPIQKMTFSAHAGSPHIQRVGYILGLAFFFMDARHMCHQRRAWKYNEYSVLRGKTTFRQNKYPMFEHGVFARQSGANRDDGF